MCQVLTWTSNLYPAAGESRTGCVGLGSGRALLRPVQLVVQHNMLTSCTGAGKQGGVPGGVHQPQRCLPEALQLHHPGALVPTSVDSFIGITHPSFFWPLGPLAMSSPRPRPYVLSHISFMLTSECTSHREKYIIPIPLLTAKALVIADCGVAMPRLLAPGPSQPGQNTSNAEAPHCQGLCCTLMGAASVVLWCGCVRAFAELPLPFDGSKLNCTSNTHNISVLKVINHGEVLKYRSLDLFTLPAYCL
jgi:hypothetical protein